MAHLVLKSGDWLTGILMGGAVRAHIETHTEAAAARARAAAPVSSGALRASIGTEYRVYEAKGDRIVGYVVARSPHAIEVEFGARGKAPRPFMRVAAGRA